MARHVMISIKSNPQIYFEGHSKGWALKIDTFLGPEMAASEVYAIWANCDELYSKFWERKEQEYHVLSSDRIQLSSNFRSGCE